MDESQSTETNLGVDSLGNQLTGFKQSSFKIEHGGLMFKAVEQRARNAEVRDLGLYLVYVDGKQAFVLAGWIEDEVVKSEPKRGLDNDMTVELSNQIAAALNRKARDARQ